MRNKNLIIYVGFWIALAWINTVCLPQAGASGIMKEERIAACSECHQEILEEIGSGTHLEEPLEAGTDYSDCARCHDPHPEVDGPVVSVHQFSRFGNDALCSTCHFSGNLSGASAMILPPKSLLCAPCHISDLTLDDPVSIISLAVFLLGVLGFGSVWFSGRPGNGSVWRTVLKTVFSFRFFKGLTALMLDGVIQRKLYRQDKLRWALHGLIFFPMLVRFLCGIAAAVFTTLAPENPLSQAILDKNHPIFGTLIFEYTGWMALAGIALMALKAATSKKAQKKVLSDDAAAGLPKQSKGVFYLLAGIFAAGFLLKGLRIAMTGFPEGSETAWLSFGIASFFKGLGNLTDLHSYAWYAHAILTGLFVAMLPFSRMFHMVTGPVSIALKAMQNHKR